MDTTKLTTEQIDALVRRGRVERSLYFHKMLRNSISEVKKIFVNDTAGAVPQTSR